MPLTARENQVEFEVTPAGVTRAVCYAVVDFGNQWDEKFQKFKHQVVIGFELPEHRLTVQRDGEDVDLPRAISNTYTLNLGERANLRKDLESWRGKPFTSEELEGFDIDKLLGANALINVMHKEYNGRTYANIAAIMPVPKGHGKSDAENEFQYYSMEDHGMDIPENLPEWMVNKIKNSKEWKETTEPGEPEPPGRDETEDEDDLPF